MSSLYQYSRFEIGQNIQCVIKCTSRKYISGASPGYYWVNPFIASMTGYGDMYADASDFVFIEGSDDGINWETYTLGGYTGLWQGIVCDYINYDLAFDVDFNTLGCNGITSIASTMFENAHINRIVLPTSVTRIGSYAFDGRMINANLSEFIILVKIPASVVSIGNWAFANRDSIIRIDFRDSALTKSQLNTTIFYVDVYDSNNNIDNSKYINTTIYLGDHSLEDDSFWRIQGRIPTYKYGADYEYRCYDSVNGEQIFPLYDTRPSEQYFKVYNIYENGQPKTLYLPLVPVSDTTNGGNRVQFIPGVGTYRFKK